MGLFSRIGRSTDLVSGMADRLDVTLLSVDDTINPEGVARGFRQAVFRCASCAHHGECAELQAANAHLDEAPAFCRNADLMASLQA